MRSCTEERTKDSVALVLATYQIWYDQNGACRKNFSLQYVNNVYKYLVQQVLHWRKQPDVCGSAGETDVESNVAAGH